MIRRLIPSALVALAFAIPGLALAGGHVEINTVSSLPREVAVGKVVPISFTVTFPGGEACPSAKPVVRLRSGRTTRDFTAVAAKGAPGTFLANVKLPRQGEWSVVVDAGYCNNTRTLPTVTAIAAVASTQ